MMRNLTRNLAMLGACGAAALVGGACNDLTTRNILDLSEYGANIYPYVSENQSDRSHGASGNISNVRVTPNVTINGQVGMVINTDLRVEELKGKRAKVFAAFYDGQGRPLMDRDKIAFAENGQVLIGGHELIPPYRIAEFKGEKLFMTYKQLDLPFGTGPGRYLFQLNLYDMSGPFPTLLDSHGPTAFNFNP